MNISDFDYPLPEELIAQFPLADRSQSQLLVYNEVRAGCEIRRFSELTELLNPGDLVIANDTRVVPARLFARKPSGGRVEIMLERIVDESTALVQLRSNKPLKPGQELEAGEITLVVQGRQDRFYLLGFPAGLHPHGLFDEQGTIPLPPYIQRQAIASDNERYQTVFSQRPGAVAAPTAGLHIDQPLIDKLGQRGVDWAVLTLHVGAGTFLPVSADNLDDHVMHAERVSVSQGLCDKINRTRQQGGAIIAIGTTVVRALESAAAAGDLAAFEGETRLFIKPGFRFKVVDKLVTNFHLPRSTLLVLVSAFAGYRHVMDMYEFAVKQKMRFFSYGDAMLLERADAV